MLKKSIQILNEIFPSVIYKRHKREIFNEIVKNLKDIKIHGNSSEKRKLSRRHYATFEKSTWWFLDQQWEVMEELQISSFLFSNIFAYFHLPVLRIASFSILVGFQKLTFSSLNFLTLTSLLNFLKWVYISQTKGESNEKY